MIEKSRIPTASISLLREVTKRVKPPHALVVDRPLGYPLGPPHDMGFERPILRAALKLLRHPVQERLLVDFAEGAQCPAHVF